MKGKEKCKILKEIRAEIAKANGIEWVTENCTHKGECRGTCPTCESEVRALEREIERRRALGKTVALAGISASLLVSTMGCDELIEQPDNTVDGDYALPESSTTTPSFDGGMPIEEPGEVYMPFYSTDFEPLDDPEHYLINRAIYFELLADVTYPEQTPPRLESNMRVSVVGTSDDGMCLVELENGALVAIYSRDLDECAELLPSDDTENPEAGADNEPV